jgi:hypothetical protein
MTSMRLDLVGVDQPTIGCITAADNDPVHTAA